MKGCFLLKIALLHGWSLSSLNCTMIPNRATHHSVLTVSCDYITFTYISVLRQLSFDQVRVSFLVKIGKREVCSNNVLVCIFKKHLLMRRDVYRGVETSILFFRPDLIRFYYGLLFPIYVNFNLRFP